jgi:RNA-directed DNA polymerase
MEEFDKDLTNNLYKIWNRMPAGSHFPHPVMAVEIPNPNGGGTRNPWDADDLGRSCSNGGGQ